MLRHIEAEAAFEPATYAIPSHAIAPVHAEDDYDVSHLPREHPAWATDTLSLSSRARALLATIKPVFLRVLTFWDHRIRSTNIGSLRIGIDAAGCYRLER